MEIRDYNNETVEAQCFDTEDNFQEETRTKWFEIHGLVYGLVECGRTQELYIIDGEGGPIDTTDTNYAWLCQLMPAAENQTFTPRTNFL